MTTYKKKIRGWKRHVRNLEKWKEGILNPNLDLIKLHKRDHEGIWLPYYCGFNKVAPPNWYSRKILDALIDVYMNWNEVLNKSNEKFNLRIWLYDPKINSSEIVVDYGELHGFYDNAFLIQKEDKLFPYYKYIGLKDKLDQFEWVLHYESEHYFEDEWLELIESDDEAEQIWNEVKEKSNEIYESKNYGGKQYIHYVGDVWVGTLKK